MEGKQLNILLLCNKPNVGNDANTIVDHIEAFESYSSHNVLLCSNLGDLSVKLNLDRFDVVIIHYSLCLLNNYYISKDSKRRLRNYKGLKVVFIQDEYRRIDQMISELSYLDIDVLFTCFPEQEMKLIYPESKLPKVALYNNLTGYVPERLLHFNDQQLMSSRSTHIAYRGRKLPYWYGELAYEKWNIVDQWLEHTSGTSLKADVSYNEKDRIYGDNWVKFLSSCKTTLGVESGASVMDFSGDLEREIDLHQLTHPNDSFHTVQQKYLLEFEGKYKLNQISPRCFEAIALKTVLVLYEGEYSGILVPGRHYIMLNKDFGNIKAVITQLQDDEFLQNMADVTFQEIALNPEYSYQHFVEHVSKIINFEFVDRGIIKTTTEYNDDEFQRDIKYLSLKSKFYKHRLALYQKLPVSVRLLVRGVVRPKSAVKYMFRLLFSVLRPGKNTK